MNAPFISRRSGSIAWRSAEGLSIHVPGRPLDVGLSATAAAVWSLCDGDRRVSDLLRHLGELFPDQRDEVAEELPRALATLDKSGLTHARERARREYPVLRVALAAFWPGLVERDNPIVHLLTERFSVVLGSPEEADLLIYSTFGAVPETDPDTTLRLFYAPLGLPTTSRYDYDVALIGRGEPNERHLQLPSWSLYCDWRTRRERAAAHPDGGELLSFDPEQVCGRLVAALEACQDAPSRPRSTPPRARSPEPRVAFGMATHGDYDGVYFTVQALHLYHPEILERAEILILDNAPEDPAAEPLERLANAVPGARYEAFDEYTGTAIRDLIFRLARAPLVVCLDSHVLLLPGALRRLVEHFENDPESRDLFQGPLLYDDHKTLSTHFRPVWGDGMYGQWGYDPRGGDPDGAPFEIQVQGLGLFACGRASWPGLNPRLRGFGGEEGYLHEKFRRQGGRVWCLPFLRWQHRFGRPTGTSFPNRWDDRVRNYLIAHHELGLDPSPVHQHFTDLLGEANEAAIRARVEAEMADPLYRFDALYDLGGRSSHPASRRLVKAPPSHEAERALGHRQAIERALRFGFDTVLVADSLPASAPAWRITLDRAWGEEWSVLLLEDPAVADGGSSLAYHRRALPRLLAEIPAEVNAIARWLDGGSYSERVAHLPGFRRVTAGPAELPR